MKSIFRFAAVTACALPLLAAAQVPSQTTVPATPMSTTTPPSIDTVPATPTPKQAIAKRKAATKTVEPASEPGDTTTRSPSTPTTKNDGATKP